MDQPWRNWKTFFIFLQRTLQQLMELRSPKILHALQKLCNSWYWWWRNSNDSYSHQQIIQNWMHLRHLLMDPVHEGASKLDTADAINFCRLHGHQGRSESSSASSWTSRKIDEDQAPLFLHGHQWKIGEDQATLPLIVMDINWRWFRIKLLCPSSSWIKLLCLLFIAIKKDRSTPSSTLPLHEISKDRSASSSTASSWTPMKIRMNLKPWEIAMDGLFSKEKSPLWHGNLLRSAFKVWFSQQCSSIFFCFGREIGTILCADLNFSSVCLGDFPPSARRIRIPDEAGCLGFRGVHAYKARGCIVWCISWCMRAL